MSAGKGAPRVRGFIPAGWFPGAITTDGTNLFIANVKGEGSRNEDPKKAASTSTATPAPSRR